MPSYKLVSAGTGETFEIGVFSVEYCEIQLEIKSLACR